MGRIKLETFILAPIERCFDLSRSIEAHVASAANTGERVVGGVKSGLMTLGDRVTWEATHFGIRQRIEVAITEMKSPTMFTDAQVSGIFHSFSHTHHFEPKDSGTMMTDDFRFVCPLGLVGHLVADRIVTAHLTRFLRERNAEIKRIAESEKWRSFLKANFSCSQGFESK